MKPSRAIIFAIIAILVTGNIWQWLAIQKDRENIGVMIATIEKLENKNKELERYIDNMSDNIDYMKDRIKILESDSRSKETKIEITY